MSQILIISDTHFLRKPELERFISSFDHITDIIHCGDIYIGFQPRDITGLYLCKGNNDFANLPRIGHFKIDGVTFTITHGYLNNYAYNPKSLKNLLNEYPADVICFGHTHVPYFYQDEDVMIINPGSLALSRTYPKHNTYVVFDTETKKATFYDAQTREEIKLPLSK